MIAAIRGNARREVPQSSIASPTEGEAPNGGRMANAGSNAKRASHGQRKERSQRMSETPAPIQGQAACMRYGSPSTSERPMRFGKLC